MLSHFQLLNKINPTDELNQNTFSELQKPKKKHRPVPQEGFISIGGKHHTTNFCNCPSNWRKDPKKPAADNDDVCPSLA